MSKPPGRATNVTVAAFFHGFEDIRPQWNTPFELCLLTIVTL